MIELTRKYPSMWVLFGRITNFTLSSGWNGGHDASLRDSYPLSPGCTLRHPPHACSRSTQLPSANGSLSRARRGLSPPSLAHLFEEKCKNVQVV